jgi:hypothetical protein
LALTLPIVEKLIADDPKALQSFREETTGKPHVHTGSDADTDNVRIKHGNSRAYTLDRLKRKAPRHYEQVVRKEISALKVLGRFFLTLGTGGSEGCRTRIAGSSSVTPSMGRNFF